MQYTLYPAKVTCYNQQFGCEVQTRGSSIGIDNEKESEKAIPLQALTVPEGSRKLRLQDFNTIGT